MKKFFLLPLMATALIFAGCSDDDDNGSSGPPAGPDTVVGTWQYSRVVTEVDMGDGTMTTQPILTGGCEPTPTLVLTEDGELTTDDFELTADQEGNFTCETGEELSGTYELIDGNTYLLVYGEGEEATEEEAELTLSNNNNTLSVTDPFFGNAFIIQYSRQ